MQDVPPVSDAMMPLEHVFLGYVCYSVFVHAVVRDAPTSKETLVVAFASLLPDVIDKPLAWEFGVFASGNALAHSIFIAVPVSFAVGWLTARRGRPRIGWAFAVGYLLHPVTDVVAKYLYDGEFQPEKLLWPVRRSGNGYENGFAGELTLNVLEYAIWVSNEVASGDPDPYLFVLLAVGIIGVSLWIYDGMPLGREVSHIVRKVAAAVVRSVS